jgi:hypothetical protein
LVFDTVAQASLSVKCFLVSEDTYRILEHEADGEMVKELLRVGGKPFLEPQQPTASVELKSEHAGWVHFQPGFQLSAEASEARLSWYLVFVCQKNLKPYAWVGSNMFTCNKRVIRDPGSRSSKRRPIPSDEGSGVLSAGAPDAGGAGEETVINGNLRVQGVVTCNSVHAKGADYAELFPKACAGAIFEPGTVVGVDASGKVSADTKGAATPCTIRVPSRLSAECSHRVVRF